jgi:hypothetical protein
MQRKKPEEGGGCWRRDGTQLMEGKGLKVHKIENFFGSEFEFYTISLLVMLK